MNLSELKHIYFIGIGGIGMSALARYFRSNDIRVTGYDKTKTELTSELQKEGIEIFFDDNSIHITSDVDLVVYTPAIPSSHQELSYVRKNNIQLMKRSELLGKITEGLFTIAIAGTHGKTTITSIVAHIFKQAGESISAFVGGIANNYQTNFIGEFGAKICIVEADEYDRSFLTLAADILLISSIDADHLDVYGTKDHLVDSFNLLIKKGKKNNRLILKDKLILETDNKERYSYSLTDGNFSSHNVEIIDGSYHFDIKTNDCIIENIRFTFPGHHNVENAVAATAIAKIFGLSDEVIKNALQTYIGVKRRFEIIVKQDDCIFIDDYAHHPEELKVCIQSVKELYPDKKITGIFQPHLFTRTRDFAEEFARSLELLDSLILLDIYPARENPIEGINSSFLLEKINLKEKYHLSRSEVLSYVEDIKPNLLLTLGAGDIDQLVEPIKNKLVN